MLQTFLKAWLMHSNAFAGITTSSGFITTMWSRDQIAVTHSEHTHTRV